MITPIPRNSDRNSHIILIIIRAVLWEKNVLLTLRFSLRFRYTFADSLLLPTKRRNHLPKHYCRTPPFSRLKFRFIALWCSFVLNTRAMDPALISLQSYANVECDLQDTLLASKTKTRE